MLRSHIEVGVCQFTLENFPLLLWWSKTANDPTFSYCLQQLCWSEAHKCVELISEDVHNQLSHGTQHTWENHNTNQLLIQYCISDLKEEVRENSQTLFTLVSWAIGQPRHIIVHTCLYYCVFMMSSKLLTAYCCITSTTCQRANYNLPAIALSPKQPQRPA